MKKCCKIFFFSTLFWYLLLNVANSCTTFCLDHGGRLVFGRNHDWNVGDGLVIINKRDVTKTSILVALKQTNKALTWTSKFGSVTFNQSGREFPLGGINEAGLVVESMMLDDTYYSKSDPEHTLLPYGKHFGEKQIVFQVDEKHSFYPSSNQPKGLPQHPKLE